MESLGNKLKMTRESRGESIDDVSFRINVASRYLKALETEDFSVFPGEVYAQGFLKNYGEYLGIDMKELTTLYNAMKLQEEPVPPDILKPPRHQFPTKTILTIFGVFLGLALVAGAVYFISRLPKREPSEPKPRKTKDWVFDSAPVERRLYMNDSFLVPFGDAEFQFTLMDIGDTVTLSSDNEELKFELGTEKQLDLDEDGTNDIKITALDFVKNKPSTGARLRLEFDNSPVAKAEEAPAPEETFTKTDTNGKTQTMIFSSPTPYPFTLQVNFADYCLFRWEILAESNRQGRNEQYFEKNKELNIQAQNGVRIGVSNAAAVKIQAIGGGKTITLDIGSAGEVIVAEIHWIKEEENRYRLVLDALE